MAKFDRQYPSTLDAGNQALDDLLDWLTAHNLDGAPARALSLAVSEAFTNAVVHGNALDPAKKVRLKLDINESRIRADIQDQGQGGVHQIESRRPSSQLDEGGRGIDLIKVYADTCRFTELDGGGLQVTMEFQIDDKLCSDKRIPQGGYNGNSDA
jgi:serine/threonine-protein kinase RsbW